MGHLRANGFTVKTVLTQDLPAVKTRLGIPPALESCHTAQVGGYLIEGHVPADTIKRLLKERPAVVGLAVPGMPVGAPGMESPGQTPERYQVLAFDKNRKTTVFDSR